MTSPAVLSITVTPKTEADRERLGVGLQKLTAEDTTLRAQTDHTGQVVIGAMGELQLEIVMDRLKREFGVEATVGKPQVIYSGPLEPVMRVEVSVPEEYQREVVGNLESRRGHIQSQEKREGIQIIQARVALSEMFGYAGDLRSRTLGRGTYTMQFDRYEMVPGGAEDGDGYSFAGVPWPPKPPANNPSIALPEPDDA